MKSFTWQTERGKTVSPLLLPPYILLFKADVFMELRELANFVFMLPLDDARNRDKSTPRTFPPPRFLLYPVVRIYLVYRGRSTWPDLGSRWTITGLLLGRNLRRSFVKSVNAWNYDKGTHTDRHTDASFTYRFAILYRKTVKMKKKERAQGKLEEGWIINSNDHQRLRKFNFEIINWDNLRSL